MSFVTRFCGTLCMVQADARACLRPCKLLHHQHLLIFFSEGLIPVATFGPTDSSGKVYLNGGSKEEAGILGKGLIF